MTSRYQNGLIYKIVCNNPEIKDCYVGSCCNLRSRKACHKSDCNNKKNKRTYNLNVYQFIRDNGGWQNWNMIQIEPYPCNTKRELELRERHWFEQLEANLNGNIPSRTIKEWHQDNPEYMKKYEQQKKQIRKCVCGSEYNYGKSHNRNQHYRSQKHNNYITALHQHLSELMSQS